MFSFEHAQEEKTFSLDHITIEPCHSSYSPAKFDLSFNAYETKEGLGIAIDYATDLFESQTIVQLGEHFKVLLESIVKDPTQLWHTYPLLTKKEHNQLLAWNDTHAPYDDKKVHELFQEQVQKNPDNIALVYEDQFLTYQHLNEKANQLAHYLRGLGVGPDVLVAIAVERSLDMIIGLLGILKAGGAYVPLDPTYPQERLQFMLDDTKSPVLLTQSGLKDLFKDYAGKIVILDTNIFKKQAKTNPHVLTEPYNLAYVIYTSGSTGRPKGVFNTHSGLCSID